MSHHRLVPIRGARFAAAATLVVASLAGLFGSTSGAGAAIAPKTPPLSTPWTAQVSPTNALPEYPRPQLVRTDWQNLNGEWQFANAAAGQAPPVGQTLAERILVPYPVESALSGIMRKQDRMWYRRTFTVPTTWNGRRVQLHFGAVDWEATVYVNGVNVGSHRGGFDGFSFDITPRLNGGTNEIIVGVYDPTDAGGQAVGKQRNNPSGIFYTSASGIWQTVWLEPTTFASITRLDMTPDVPGGALRLTVRGANINGHTVQATAFSGGVQVGTASGAVGAEIRVPVPNARLWSPDDPFLYDLKVTLRSSTGTPLEQVSSYFGMRSVGLKMLGGVLRPTLNGQFVFQMGTLDQGYWPDGIYTAPTDEALRFDIQKHKDLGFNMIRKHIKVEPQRWFYWADKLGLLVWQDMPSMDHTKVPSTSARQQWEVELRAMVDQHRSSPSLVTWVSQNEGWGQYDQARIADLIKQWDPSRLVDNMSGINCCGSVDGGNGDIADFHTYVGPDSPYPSETRVAVLGEYGGLGLVVPGHEWSPGNGFSYEMQPNAAALTNRYVGLIERTQALMIHTGLSAAIYTEITDVENEVNGLLTYDRQVMKPDVTAILTAHRNLIAASKNLNSQGMLAVDRHQSLRVTTPGFTDRYLRHYEGLGFTEVVNGSSSGTLKQDATFKVVRGLADASCYSFESRNFAGHYLRHSGYRVRKDARDGTALFNADATFCARPGLSGVGVTFESYNTRGYHLRHHASEVYIATNGGPNPWDATASYAQDVSWRVATPWWRSGVNLGVDRHQSLQVTTPGFTDRYLRHRDSLGFTEVVNGSSSTLLKQDATFRVVRGLADASCYSLESRNFPGNYLRHRDHRIRHEPRDGSALYDADATFCAQPGQSGVGVTFESYNQPGYHLRHYAAEVFIARNGGPRPFEAPRSYPEDVSWNVVAPWAP